MEKGELREAEKIGAAAAEVLGRNHGHRYFEHPVNFARETSGEGKYVIPAEEPSCRRWRQ